MKYTVAEASKKLPELLEKACFGEEIVIAGSKKGLVKLVPVLNREAPPRTNRNRMPGRLKGKIFYNPNAFDSLTEQELPDLGFE